MKYARENKYQKQFEVPDTGGVPTQALNRLSRASNARVSAPLSDCISLNRNGFVKLHKALLDHPVKRDGAALIVFIDLLLNAEWLDGRKVFFKKKIITLKSGQLTLGRYQLANNTGLKPSTAWGALVRLSKKYEITDILTDTKYSLITIRNYNRYQNNKKEADTHTDTTTNTTADTTTDTIKELKNLRSKEKEINKTPQSALFSKPQEKIIKQTIADKNHHTIDSEANKLAFQKLAADIASDKSIKKPTAVAMHRASL